VIDRGELLAWLRAGNDRDAMIERVEAVAELVGDGLAFDYQYFADSAGTPAIAQSDAGPTHPCGKIFSCQPRFAPISAKWAFPAFCVAQNAHYSI
jgi:hypothetical protein